MAENGAITWRRGVFAESDLDNTPGGAVALVISATDDQPVNETVARAAAARKILCNVVDQPALCDFITPALITRGDLQITVSSGGVSPTVAQRVRREIGEIIGEEYSELLEIAGVLRRQLRECDLSFAQRRDLLRDFVESAALDLLRAGDRAGAMRLADDVRARVPAD
ncbi:MAG: bifunctional precorrin-2 dehydrogenase/sirohydrochlorin ferrochelatase, partial [Blastocatellia bacterium]